MEYQKKGGALKTGRQGGVQERGGCLLERVGYLRKGGVPETGWCTRERVVYVVETEWSIERVVYHRKGYVPERW